MYNHVNFCFLISLLIWTNIVTTSSCQFPYVLFHAKRMSLHTFKWLEIVLIMHSCWTPTFYKASVMQLDILWINKFGLLFFQWLLLALLRMSYDSYCISYIQTTSFIWDNYASERPTSRTYVFGVTWVNTFTTGRAKMTIWGSAISPLSVLT
jgi:hypothetical protein